MAAVAIVGVLMAISAPGWQSFKNRQTLNVAQQEVWGAIRESQKKAILHRRTWQTSFRERRGRTQWVTHPAGEAPLEGSWQNLPSNVRLDRETTLRRVKGGVRHVKFDHQGNVEGRLGHLALSLKDGGSMKRCVEVSTLLGAMRSEANQARKGRGRGKYCS